MIIRSPMRKATGVSIMSNFSEHEMKRLIETCSAGVRTDGKRPELGWACRQCVADATLKSSVELLSVCCAPNGGVAGRNTFCLWIQHPPPQACGACIIIGLPKDYGLAASSLLSSNDTWSTSMPGATENLSLVDTSMLQGAPGVLPGRL